MLQEHNTVEYHLHCQKCQKNVLLKLRMLTIFLYTYFPYMKYEPIIFVAVGILPPIKAKGWTKIAKKIEKKGSGN